MGLVKQWGKLDKALKKTAKETAKNLKIDKKVIASAKAQQKVHAKTEKSLQKLRKEQKKLAAEATRTQKSMMKSAKAASAAGGGGARGSGGGGGGIGFGLPAFLSVTAITLATKALAGWTLQLGFAEAKAQSLAGSFRNITDTLGDSRSQELFVKFAEQVPGSISRRFSSQIEIEGLKQLREQLSKKLGDSFGTELALKLTASFGKSNAELTEFLAQSSVSVSDALAAFESRDIETFAQALAAVNQKSSDLTKTAISLEQAWIRIKQAAEAAFRDFVATHGGDIQTAVKAIADGLIDAINWVRQFGHDMQNVIAFTIKGFESIGKAGEFLAFLGGDDTMLRARLAKEAKIKGMLQQIQDEKKEAQFFTNKAAALQVEGASPSLIKTIEGLAQKRLDVADSVRAELDVLQGKLPNIEFDLVNVLDRVKREQEAATKAAQKQREEIEKALTPAEEV